MNLRILAFLCILAPVPITAAASSPWTITKVADGTTPCPGGKGNFYPSNEFPAINGAWVVFVDSGQGNCVGGFGQSIWSYNLLTKKLVRLVDVNTAVPAAKSGGKFTSFVNLTSNTLQINGGLVLYSGQGTGSNSSDYCSDGLYTVPVTGGTSHRVVDYSMTLPGYGGSFCYPTVDTGTPFGIQGMSLFQNKVYFSAYAKNPNTGSPNFGIWWAPANVNTKETDIHLIADSSVVYESKLPKGCSDTSCLTINGWNGAFAAPAGLAFSGIGDNPGPNGLFLNTSTTPILLSNYVLPGDKAPSKNYPDDASLFLQPVIDGNNIFFIGNDPNYTGTCGNGGGSGQGQFWGIFETTIAGGSAKAIMTTCNSLPASHKVAGSNSFLSLAASEGIAVFGVEDETTGESIDDVSVNGAVSQLIAPGQALPTGANCDGSPGAAGCAYSVWPAGNDGISGGRVVFTAEGGATPSDEGVYLASLACAAKLTTGVSLQLGKPAYNSKSKSWTQTVTIDNKGTKPLSGPISLALTKLTAGVTLTNPTGSTVCFATPGSTFVDFNLTNGRLSAGQSAQLTLDFAAPSTAKITFTPAVAGSGAR